MPRADSLASLFQEACASGAVRRLLELARDEDLGPPGGPGDVTSRLWINSDGRQRARIVAREQTMVSGLAAVPMLVEVFGGGVDWMASMSDGDAAPPGAVLGTVAGDAQRLLALERTLLNLLGRLCGVATMTRQYVSAVRAAEPSGRCRVFDTRKTTPGLRMLEKYAVRCGGGENHRVGLFDAVLIKDNHLAAMSPSAIAERLREVSAQAKAESGVRFVEVEVDTLDQLSTVLAAGPGVVDIVLLDNMAQDQLVAAVDIRNRARPEVLLEASGGVTLEKIGKMAQSGIERISVGALTHHAAWADIGLDSD